MTNARFEYFAKMNDEQKMNLNRSHFTLSECQEILNETRLNDLDKEIARLWLLDCLSIEQIADKIGYDKRTIHKHIFIGKKNKPCISKCLKLTCVKLFVK